MSTTSSCERLLALAIAAPLLLATGCHRPRESPDEHAVRTAVARYDQALVETFRSGREDLLVDVAGPTEVSRVALVMAGLRAQGKVMEARQLEFTPLEVRVGASGDGAAAKATVRARERWTYRHLPPSGVAGRSVERKEATYHMVYTLGRAQGRWIVESSSVEE